MWLLLCHKIQGGMRAIAQCLEQCALSVADDQHTSQRELKPLAGVERVKQCHNLLEVSCSLVHVSHRNDGVIDVLHHAGLEEILQHGVVDDCATCLNLQHRSVKRAVGIGGERLFNLAVASEQDWNVKLVSAGLTDLHSLPKLHQLSRQYSQHRVAWMEALLAIDDRLNFELMFLECPQHQFKMLWKTGTLWKELPIDHWGSPSPHQATRLARVTPPG